MFDCVFVCVCVCVCLGVCVVVSLCRCWARQTGTARFLQAVYRGHVGRTLHRRLAHDKYKMECIKLLQCAYRGHISRLLFSELWQQRHEQAATLRLQRVTRGHLARNKVRDFIEGRQRARIHQAATHLQRVYRGHHGRIIARTEGNKLRAQYNMGWLSTYLEQLREVAAVEHWDVFRGSVSEIAHRVRDLLATYEYEQALRLAKQAGKPPPKKPGVYV